MQQPLVIQGGLSRLRNCAEHKLPIKLPVTHGVPPRTLSWSAIARDRSGCPPALVFASQYRTAPPERHADQAQALPEIGLSPLKRLTARTRRFAFRGCA